MELVDTHAHLDLPEFERDLVHVLRRAAEAGVDRIVCVGTDLASSGRCVELARRFPARLYAAVGVHPNHCAEAGSEDFERIGQLARLPEVVALGETGLDFHRTYSDRELQVRWLREHIRLALSLDKPLILHARKADEELLRLLREEAHRVRGVRHCFDGAAQVAAQYAALGMHIGFGGALTKPGHKKLKAAAAQVPARHVLVETDCPYVRPAQVPAGRNEPAFIVHTLGALARVRQTSPEQIAQLTTCNAARLFFGEQ